MIMKLPTSAMTSLCEIRFDRKNVVPMNVLMCRKIIAALYQVIRSLVRVIRSLVRVIRSLVRVTRSL